MARVIFKLHGAEELERTLREFGPRFTTNVSGRALRAGAKPIPTIAKQKAPQPGSADDPYATGALKKSIATRLRRARGGQRTMEIGFRPPTSRRAHLIEYGTARMAAEPFMRPALDEGGGPAFAEILRVLREGIAREALARSAIADDSDPE